MKSWGYLLSLDMARCIPNTIRQDVIIRAFTQTLVREIDMIAFGPPQVVWFGSGNKGGYTLVQLIETSSITGHFCEETNDAYLDVFSCKPFAPETVKRVVAEYFNPEAIRMTFLERQAPGPELA
jgi:S-adenosylmethionine/arginine decarboxylase-like enzyme